MISGAVQLRLLAALADIHRWPAGEIRGTTKLWTAAAIISFVGPISYVLFEPRR